MTILELYKFIHENKIEWYWNDDQLIAFIPSYNIEDFCNILSIRYFDDGNIECRLCPNGSIGLDLGEICDYYGIDANKIFSKETKQGLPKVSPDDFRNGRDNINNGSAWKGENQ